MCFYNITERIFSMLHKIFLHIKGKIKTKLWSQFFFFFFAMLLCSFAQSCPTLCNSMDCILQSPLSMKFFRHEYWNSCHSPRQRIFLTQELKPCLLCLQHWEADSLTLCHLESPINFYKSY